MEPIFKINVDEFISASLRDSAFLVKFLLEKGLIYEKTTDSPEDCSECCFDKFTCISCWAYCDANIIYKWNTLSENYVGENEK